MSENESYTTGIFQEDKTHETDVQRYIEALEARSRAYDMLIKVLDYLKTEVEYEKAGGTTSPSDFMNKIIGLAHEYDLPEIRERALGYQEAGR
jgi:hypothetical protein